MTNDLQKEERVWAMLVHLAALIVFLRIPFGNLIGPLIIWLIKRKTMPLVDVNGKESLNFQISITIYSIISALLIFIYVGIILLWAIALADIVLVVIASVKTSNGENYKYPWTIRLIK